MSFTRNEKIAGGLLLAAAIGLTVVALKKSSPVEKRATLKKLVSDAAGDDKAAAVDKMSDQEVDTVTDTLMPNARTAQPTEEESADYSSDSGSGGGGSSSSPTNTTTPPSSTTPSLNPGYTLPAPSLSPGSPTTLTPITTVVTTQSPTQVRNLVAHRPRIAPMIVTHRSTPVRRTTIIRRGIGAIDGTDCVSILKKYGIM